MPLQRPVKSIEHGDQVQDHPLDAAASLFVAVPFSTLAKILKIGLAADQRLQQFFLLSAQFI